MESRPSSTVNVPSFSLGGSAKSDSEAPEPTSVPCANDQQSTPVCPEPPETAIRSVDTERQRDCEVGAMLSAHPESVVQPFPKAHADVLTSEAYVVDNVVLNDQSDGLDAKETSEDEKVVTSARQNGAAAADDHSQIEHQDGASHADVKASSTYGTAEKAGRDEAVCSGRHAGELPYDDDTSHFVDAAATCEHERGSTSNESNGFEASEAAQIQKGVRDDKGGSSEFAEDYEAEDGGFCSESDASVGSRSMSKSHTQANKQATNIGTKPGNEFESYSEEDYGEQSSSSPNRSSSRPTSRNDVNVETESLQRPTMSENGRESYGDDYGEQSWQSLNQASGRSASRSEVLEKKHFPQSPTNSAKNSQSNREELDRDLSTPSLNRLSGRPTSRSDDSETEQPLRVSQKLASDNDSYSEASSGEQSAERPHRVAGGDKGYDEDVEAEQLSPNAPLSANDDESSGEDSAFADNDFEGDSDGDVSPNAKASNVTIEHPESANQATPEGSFSVAHDTFEEDDDDDDEDYDGDGFEDDFE
eukprot:TRINITY_DN50310_c0_g1_i1.p1 TRINITY_DN50310_c0_g1~~TRINITY_DN50310_c0_g1_i1.p1  ORF type:complete len:598 (-),score=144.16 TRINITY_DN50310_c0_g1_i1:149-1744(-)